MTGVVNVTGARSGIVGTISGATSSNDWTTNAAGGIVTNYKTGGTFYQVHTFYGTGLFEANKTLSCDMLIVAGGGGGGGYNGSTNRYNSSHVMGGGGAGAMGEISGLSVPAGAYIVNVGKGGQWWNGGTTVIPGGASSFTGSGVTDMTCNGGGTGGTYSNIAGSQKNGGSGGGTDQNGSAGSATTGSGGSMSYYGNAGGGGASNAGGGGGGAGGAGANVSEGGPKGGLGRNNSLQTGSNQMYCEGGGYYTSQGNIRLSDNGFGHGGQPYRDGAHGVVIIRYAV